MVNELEALISLVGLTIAVVTTMAIIDLFLLQRATVRRIIMTFSIHYDKHIISMRHWRRTLERYEEYQSSPV